MNVASLVSAVIAIWIVGYVVTTMLAKLGVPQMKTWFVEFTRNCTSRPLSRFWVKHKRKVVWMILGGIVTVALLVHNHILVFAPSQ